MRVGILSFIGAIFAIVRFSARLVRHGGSAVTTVYVAIEVYFRRLCNSALSVPYQQGIDLKQKEQPAGHGPDDQDCDCGSDFTLGVKGFSIS